MTTGSSILDTILWIVDPEHFKINTNNTGNDVGIESMQNTIRSMQTIQQMNSR